MKKSLALTVVSMALAFMFGCQTPGGGIFLPPGETNSPTVTIPKKPGKVSEITSLAEGHACTGYKWNDRGRAPKAYIKGMAIAYARAICHQGNNDYRVISKASGAYERDALVRLGISARAGKEATRATYLTLIGLGMRESSGRHCVGRDQSANNTDATTCEAGLFQTSYNSSSGHETLPKLYEAFKSGKEKCYLDVFKEGVSCNDSNWKNYGSGEGVTFQKLSKECPMFATEYAAIMIRTNGSSADGSKGHYGPVRAKHVELNADCGKLLDSVEKYVDSHKGICDTL